MDLRDILFLSVTTEQTKISVHIWSRPDAPWTAALQWAKKKDDEEETLQYKTVININRVLDTKDKTKTKTKAKQHEQNSKIEVGPTSSQPSKLVGENNPQLTVSPTELWSLWPWSDFVGTKLTIPLNSLLSCLSYLLLKKSMIQKYTSSSSSSSSSRISLLHSGPPQHHTHSLNHPSLLS